MTRVVLIPRRFQGTSMPRVAAEVTSLLRDHGPGCEISFDLSTLEFVRPAGVVFLTNLAQWLEAEGCRVRFMKPVVRSEACRYLDDSEFFLQRCGARFWSDSKVRSTSMPVQLIKQERIHSWLRATLIPWLSHSLGVSPSTLSDLQVCISELFNNIKEHTRHDIGSIFVQHYPNEKRIIVVIADFGVGIPETARRVDPNLSDTDAVISATKEGFTSKSVSTNQGYGLDILLKFVVERNKGEVTIFSRKAIVRFKPSEAGFETSAMSETGFCPGTTIEIKLRTDTLVEAQEDEEDFEW